MVGREGAGRVENVPVLITLCFDGVVTIIFSYCHEYIINTTYRARIMRHTVAIRKYVVCAWKLQNWMVSKKRGKMHGPQIANRLIKQSIKGLSGEFLPLQRERDLPSHNSRPAVMQRSYANSKQGQRDRISSLSNQSNFLQKNIYKLTFCA